MAWIKQKAIFIAFEGGEGAGKTTQARLLYEQLKRNRRMALYTDEPGATLKGFQIRSILLDRDEEPLDPIAEFFLFEADRAQHVAQIIKPALNKGSDIVCDRFSPSTFAYQGYGRGLNKRYLAEMKKVDAFARSAVEPDLYILLDIDPARGLRRIKSSKTRFEEEEAAFHKRVREGFLLQAKNNTKQWFVIDAGQAQKTIQKQIWERVEKLIRS